MWLSLQIKITSLRQHYIQEGRVNIVHVALKSNHILMLQVSALNITYPYQHTAKYLGCVPSLFLLIKLKII